MREVARTIKPSHHQATRMARDLSKKYKKYVHIDLTCTSRVGCDSGSAYESFWLYVADTFHEHFISWKELQDTYFKLMEAII